MEFIAVVVKFPGYFLPNILPIDTVVSLDRPIFQLNINFWTHSKPKFESFGHLPPLCLFAILNMFHHD